VVSYAYASRTVATPAAVPRAGAPAHAPLLDLQRRAGNRAVAGLLASVQRDEDEDIYDDTPAPPPGVTGYIGLNPGANKEAKQLRNATRQQVLTSLNDPEAEKKLKQNPAVFDFVADELGISPLDDLQRWDEATDVLLEADPNLREQLADMMRWFHQAEAGQVTLERLVLSGHSNGVEIWGDSPADAESKPGTMLVERDLGTMVKVFPTAAAQVQDIMFSACFSIAAVELVIEMFPNLRTCWSYSAYSPDIAGGSGGHMATWAAATEGEGTLEKSDKRGSNALWTREKGYIVGDPAAAAVGPLYTEVVRKWRTLVEPMYSGEKDVPKSELDTFYPKIQELYVHPGASADQRKAAAEARDITLRLRFWTTVREKFGTVHGAELQPAYDAIGVKPPNWSTLTRVGLKAHIDEVDKALKAHEDKTAARDTIKKLLKGGLFQLDPNVIKSGWI
jgi:hypothetical protein